MAPSLRPPQLRVGAVLAIAISISDFQIEVYDPSAAQARQLVTSGKIVSIR